VNFFDGLFLVWLGKISCFGLLFLSSFNFGLLLLKEKFVDIDFLEARKLRPSTPNLRNLTEIALVFLGDYFGNLLVK